MVCRVYKRICGSYQIYVYAEFKFAVARFEIYSIWSEINRNCFSAGSLSPGSLLFLVSSLFSCSLLFLPFSLPLLPPLFSLLPPFSPFSLLSSLLSSIFSFFLLSSYLFLSLLISYYIFSLSFSLSYSLPFFFSSSPLSLCLPSALCSLLVLIFDLSKFDNLSKLKWWKWWIIKVQWYKLLLGSKEDGNTEGFQEWVAKLSYFRYRQR